MLRPVSIRTECPADLASIHVVHAACFPSDGEARLVDALRAAGRISVSLVAEIDDQIVGHLCFSPVSVASGATGSGLAPVSVLAAHRRRGIADDLIRAGLQAARDLGFAWVVVLGAPAYYSRFGFRRASDFGLSDEYGGGAHFQALEFAPGGLPIGAGRVRYCEEFGLL